MTTVDITTFLTGQQLKIYQHMLAAGFDIDISIASIHDVMGAKIDLLRTDREKQQQVGSAISRLNTRLRALMNHEIVPGNIKRTYRLQRIGAIQAITD